MAAEDHLRPEQFKNKVPRLFHGTIANIKDGWVDASKSRSVSAWEESDNPEFGHHAFATSNIHEAMDFGNNVYEVEYPEHDRDLEEQGEGPYGGQQYSHPDGFKIKRQIPDKVLKRIEKA